MTKNLKSARDGRLSRLFYSKVGQSVLLLIALVIVALVFIFEVLTVTDSPLLFGALLAAGGRAAGRGREYTTTRKGFKAELKAGLYRSMDKGAIAPASVVDTTSGRRFRVQYNDYRVILREEV